jgi:hypothetical protein
VSPDAFVVVDAFCVACAVEAARQRQRRAGADARARRDVGDRDRGLRGEATVPPPAGAAAAVVVIASVLVALIVRFFAPFSTAPSGGRPSSCR